MANKANTSFDLHELLLTLKRTDPHALEEMLFDSAKAGNLVALYSLVGAGIDVNKKDEGGRTALHLASEAGHHYAVMFLIVNGADVECEDKISKTPLDYAVTNGRSKVIAVLRGGQVAGVPIRPSTASATSIEIIRAALKLT